MKIAVLTSSRADYGIYLPLLKELNEDPFFDLRLIVFGTHLSSFHGYTISQIENDGFIIDHKVENILASDTSDAVATSMAIAFTRFTNIWAQECGQYDLVFCLGDRYEMFAAVSAAAPYRVKFAHIHGGETTLGAIDNEFRHCLSVFSTIHFTATDTFAQRVAEIKGHTENIYSVGSLSLDNMDQLKLMSSEEFHQLYNIDLSIPTFLITFHPETAGINDNTNNAKVLINSLESFREFQMVITMPNADTNGNAMRKVYEEFASQNKNVILVENFGTEGYFNCMNLCTLVVGNSSSGIIEAASFKKFVVNLGDRQLGRVTSNNVLHSPNEINSIREAIKSALSKGVYEGENVYFKNNVARQIIQVLKTWSQQDT